MRPLNRLSTNLVTIVTITHMDTLLLEEIKPTTWDVQNPVNDGIQLPFPQLVCRISEPSTVSYTFDIHKLQTNP